ncbi:plasmid pRiA4b ORF-3 family protein [Accumulibacter sp.]|uniref:plasmid pRiA4b ORF-3 family protein n=1 Tax=Accumulibacter sp. TaxID=2053492 RepID=UPI0025EF06FF|nr:plasmid pRiA4b ORF-3 family protein [Accumulibacter sp.]MCM8594025.1 plasmid pRiA4b ORF-3 family protein [Accumulibacter sp.]MDS4048168.1 plasmid pRiA4b ORF-3 family protein [Accumulibacter sp.]
MTTLSLSDADRAAFAAVASAEAPPGTIVHDFDSLLDYLGRDGVPVSPKASEFAIARLPELNGLLTHPAPIGLSRGRQVSYPHVDGLHLLLRFSRLGKIDRSSTTRRMVVDTSMATKWQLLNPTERYFTLLERWWSFADFAQERFGFTSSLAEYRLELLKRHRPGSRARKTDDKWQEVIFGLLGMKQVALMQLFGLLDIVSEPPVAGKGWQIKRMVATPWGLTACATYLQAFRHTSAALIERLFNPAGEDSAAVEEPSEDEVDRPPFFAWADAVIPFFPAWQNSLGEPDAAEPFRGSVTFKVSLSPDVWRRIVMPAESSFDALAQFILNAFKFDDEHLYQFRYQDDYAAQRSLDDPRCSDVEDDYADEVTLGEAGLFPRQVVEFHYDFGSDWRFEVLVEKLDTSETGAKPAVVAREGKAPRQYQ